MPKSKHQNSPILIDLLIQRFEWMEKEFNFRLSAQVSFRLTRAQLLFMSYLDDGQDHSSTMSQKLGLTRQAVSQIVKDLEDKGIIQQVRDPRKASAKILKTTAYGKRFVNNALETLAAIEQEIAEQIGKRRYASLLNALSADWDKSD